MPVDVRIPNLPQQREVVQLEGLLTTSQLKNRFQKGTMTIFTWRKDKGLPFIELLTGEDGKNPIRFREKDVVKWAKKNTINFLTEKEAKDIPKPKSAKKSK